MPSFTFTGPYGDIECVVNNYKLNDVVLIMAHGFRGSRDGGGRSTAFAKLAEGVCKVVRFNFNGSQILSRQIEELQAVNKNLVLVLLSGNAVEMPWVDKVPAIVQGWYLGSMGGKSIANVLSGKVNPSGKLPFSFPVKLTDCGAHAFDELSYPGDGIKQVYKEDILVGYRWHDTKKIPAAFAFGHGLSYTQFEYGKAIASAKKITEDGTLEIAVKVKNVGDVVGKEVVQLYIGDDKCSVVRPLKELKHFEKIALNPGEEKTVTFTVTVDDLKFYDDSKKDWMAETGKFKAYIGSSSIDIRTIVPFVLE